MCVCVVCEGVVYDIVICHGVVCDVRCVRVWCVVCGVWSVMCEDVMFECVVCNV